MRAILACACLLYVISPSLADDSTGLRLAPKAFRAAVERVLPSIVMIETYGGGARPPQGKRGQMVGASQPGAGPTTGLVISPDGHIITSTYNFLKKPEVITVVLPDGSRHVATLLGRDETRGWCLLKIDEVSGLPVAPVVPRSDLRVGQWAVSVGVGYGDRNPAISAGIISATSRIGGRAVQTDANISLANYGGPLVDLDGRVIGMCAPLSPDLGAGGAGAEWYDSGVGFATILDGAESLIERLKKGEELKPGRLGVALKAEGPTGGVIVEKVLPDGPAAKAGLQAGDHLTSLAGETLMDLVHARRVLSRYLAGDEIEVAADRSAEHLTLKVELKAIADAPLPSPGKTPRPKK